VAAKRSRNNGTVMASASIARTAEWAAPRFSDSYYSCCQAACR
jgi:hypothetical protein